MAEPVDAEHTLARGPVELKGFGQTLCLEVRYVAIVIASRLGAEVLLAFKREPHVLELARTTCPDSDAQARRIELGCFRRLCNRPKSGRNRDSSGAIFLAIVRVKLSVRHFGDEEVGIKALDRPDRRNPSRIPRTISARSDPIGVTIPIPVITILGRRGVFMNLPAPSCSLPRAVRARPPHYCQRRSRRRLEHASSRQGGMWGLPIEAIEVMEEGFSPREVLHHDSSPRLPWRSPIGRRLTPRYRENLPQRSPGKRFAGLSTQRTPPRPPLYQAREHPDRNRRAGRLTPHRSYLPIAPRRRHASSSS